MKCFAKKLKASSFKASARRRAARWRRVVRTLWRASAENAGGARRCVRVGCVCGAVYAGTRGGGALAVPYCLRRAKKQGCRRQPCSLSVFDGLKPMQFGFFGFLGIFFPKSSLSQGAGRSPAKSAHMRGAASHFISAAGLCVAAAKYLVYRYTDKSYADADK